MGSFPTGYLLVKKFKSIDIRKIGSGNIGSTNVKRAAGKKLSLITQLIDMVKGMLPVFIVIGLTHYDTMVGREEIMAAIFGAILGHDFTPWLKFNGGKGVNTTLGAFFPVLPIPVILAGLTFKLLKYCTKIVSIRSLVIAGLLPVYSVLFSASVPYILATLVAAVLILFQHRDNIDRLMQHREN